MLRSWCRTGEGEGVNSIITHRHDSLDSLLKRALRGHEKSSLIDLPQVV